MTDRPTVLVVDDELALLSLIADCLQDEGFNVLTAANSLVAFEMLQGRDPVHVLVTDINMPGAADGKALAHFVATTHPAIKIVLLSGRPVDDADRVDGADFMQKPFSFDDLAAKVKALTGWQGAGSTGTSEASKA